MFKQIRMRQASAIVIVCNLAIISFAACAPSQQQQKDSTTKQAATPTTLTPPTSTTTSKQTTNPSLAKAASVASALPSFVNIKTLQQQQHNQQQQQQDSSLDTFDGKNPFADDSLWQMPIHLVRDLSENARDTMSKSASEQRSSSGLDQINADEQEELDEMGPPVVEAASAAQSSSSSPTVISAITDLKTAAGYHYPSSHGHSAYNDHHGAHHGGDHYGGHHGKYFQYASVPYPYAWEFGYRRGNPYHTIERYEHGKGPHFQTKVKWSDKHGGYGVHVWDYNHDDHHSHYHGGHHEPASHGHYGGSHGHHGYGHH